VDDAYFGLADIEGVLECVADDSLAGGSCYELDALDHAIHDDVFDAGVFAFCVFSDQDCVDVVVGGFIAGD
jgi:hypothetical protein